MSFDWTDYLSLAQTLYKEAKSQPQAEARYRAAISRAYYAAFCSARNHLNSVERKGILPGARVHAEVRKTFAEHPNPVRRKIGLQLDRLFENRKRADYEDDFTGVDRAAGFTLKKATEVIETLRTL
jgi:uncharacterized protein (UPF0332 family)